MTCWRRERDSNCSLAFRKFLSMNNLRGHADFRATVSIRQCGLAAAVNSPIPEIQLQPYRLFEHRIGTEQRC
jgi:hypothetical protein